MNPLPPAHNLISTTPPSSGMDGLNYLNLAVGVTGQHVGIEENGRTGSETTYSYTGSYSALKVQQQWCRGWGAYNMSLHRIQGGSLWELVAVFPLNEYGGESMLLTGTYELDVEMRDANLLGSEIVAGKYDSLGNQLTAGLLPDNYAFAVQRCFENWQQGLYSNNYSVTNYDSGLYNAVNSTGGLRQMVTDNTAPHYYQNRAIQLLASLIRGTDSYADYYHVFKRTLTAALAIQVQASNIGKRQIWTTSELTAFENISGGFFQLDTTSLWLKSPPVVTTAARQKTQVAYNYTEARSVNAFGYTPYNAAVLKYSSPFDLPPGV
jgi:hypothetical protein